MVALQGTLETFSLPDVLQLLSSTKKTGCLRVSGDRGEGSLWVRDGAIVASEAGGSAQAAVVDVVFELLRLDTGEFVFDDGGEPADAGEPADVSSLLADAGRLLDEWREIEAVVPSSAHWVALRSELGSDDVRIDKDGWRAVVAVGGGVSVSGLGDQLDLAELAVARLVKDLSEQGLVEVGDPRDAAPASAPAPTARVAEPEPEADAPVIQAVPAAGERFEPFDRDALVVDHEAPPEAPESPAFSVVPDEVVEPPVVEPAPSPAPAPAPTRDDLTPITPEPGEAAEIARQLANLSPKAARAVAAAAKASTPEEREAALAEVEASDEQINRELLLKFLGTVN